MDVVELRALADRCENATEPDRELDAAMGLAAGLPTRDRTGEPGWDGVYFVGALPAYTSSLDAAMTLVPEGMDWRLGHTNGGLTIHAEVGGCTDEHMRFAATPALALCAAALRAHAAMEDTTDGRG